jgi:thiamine transport system ATP-binding protein
MLEVRGLTVRYGDHVAVDGLDLQAEDGEVLCILGPSGCGKSTLLRAIAGLVPPDTGTIVLDGTVLDGLRPDQRRVGLMFQDHALFPHRTVADNVGFGPRMQGLSRAQIGERVHEALTLVDLTGTDERQITSLSGGEQQRVALARAIAARPKLLMLDEPLGSLDRALRDRLLTELPPLLRELGTTVLYVTHDQDEALALADRIAVMRAGRLEQVDVPDELWQDPANPFVAGFLGLEHTFDVEVSGGVASTPLGEIPVEASAEGPRHLVLLLDALRLADAVRPVRPDEIELEGEVVGRRFAGDHLRVRVRTRSGPEVTVPVWRGKAPQVGDAVTLALDPSAARVLPPDPADGAAAGDQ